MSPFVVTRTIEAPLPKVFETVADIRNFSKAVPDIVGVEFLTEQHAGTGTRFVETRKMNGREVSTELEVTDYVENQRIRIVSEAGGSIWDTVFTTEQAGEQTQLKMVMEAKPQKLTAKIGNALIKGMLKKALEKDMEAVKVYCEG